VRQLSLAAAQESASLTSGVSGVVRFPDGSASSHATVVGVTNCEDDVHITRLKKVKTASDGSFYVPPFLSSDCNHIVLSAEKPEDFMRRGEPTMTNSSS
jgi:hypothetical protein